MRDDLRAAWRTALRHPGYTAIAVLTMALGIGAATTLFSVTYGVLVRPLPWPSPDRLVRISETRGGRPGRIADTISNGTYLAWRDAPQTIDDLAGWSTSRITLDDAGLATRLDVAFVTDGLMPLLGAAPIMGRAFTAADAPAGQPLAMILGHALWQDRFGGSPAAIGRVVRVDGRDVTIVGVMASSFAFPDRLTQAWLARGIPPVVGEQGVRRGQIFSALARLAPGVSVAQASAEGTARARSGPDYGQLAMALFGSDGPPDVTARPAIEAMTDGVRPALLLLLAAVMVLLVGATGNVAGLQLARAAARRRELSIRAALGAGRIRLVRLVLVESVATSAAGGLLGLAGAAAAHRTLPLLSTRIPRIEAVVLDWPVIAFAVVVSAAAGLAAGVLPVWQGRRGHALDALAEGGRTTPGATRDVGGRTRLVVVTAQIAIASLLVFGTATVGRSLLALVRADRGYTPRNLLTAQIPIPAAFADARKAAVTKALVERLDGLPGVERAAVGTSLPLASAGGFAAFTFRSPLDPSVEISAQAARRIVTPGYFHALGLRLTAGRPLQETDVQSAQPALVVNRTFLRDYLDNVAPPEAVGLRIDGRGLRVSRDAEIVGVVEDMRQDGVEAERQPEVFLALDQQTGTMAGFDLFVVARTSPGTEPASLAPGMRGLLRDLEPSLTLDRVMTMEERVSESLARPRLYALLLGGFAVAAVLIVSVGLFGALSFLVVQRAREFAVRVAVGATPLQVIRLLAVGTSVMAICGVGAGSAAGVWLARAYGQSLYGVVAWDALTILGTAAAMTAAVALASLIPLRRVLRLDPIAILRADT
ncbi:MAG: ADOP family duplicated permease [Vicinamibacterales bacterium]